MRGQLIAHCGVVQHLHVPFDLKELFKTIWETKPRHGLIMGKRVASRRQRPAGRSERGAHRARVVRRDRCGPLGQAVERTRCRQYEKSGHASC
eukprot:12634022-Heterocapsa_arctica.AAC.1